MFISRHTLKWTKTCRSSGDFPHAHTAHFLLNRHTMLGLVRLCSALTVACSIGLNGTLTLMVVIYPTDISLSPANFPGNKVVGIFLLIVGLATSIASAIYFWKAASQLSRSVTAQH
ncbi:hypothetical protein DRBB26_0997 [Bifidobacterium breve]|nr:hypothetical protein DRBB26_0997 [Bifidobacterium breve]